MPHQTGSPQLKDRILFMQYSLKSTLLGLMCCLSSGTIAQDDTITQEGELDKLLQVIQAPQTQTAIELWDLRQDKLLLAKDNDKLFLPASTLKLLTAVAAQYQLGNDFSFQTGLYARNVLLADTSSTGKQPGDLYLKFSGDPTLTGKDLRALLKPIAAAGVREINGNIYLVGHGRQASQAPGWVWDDLGICYAAPVSSYTIDKNCIDAELRPSTAGNKGTLHLSATLPVSITTDAIFDKGGKLAFCELTLIRKGKNHFHLGGCYPGKQPLKLAIAIDDPQQFAVDQVNKYLQSLGIRINGKIEIKDSMPDNLILIASHQSQALERLMETMLLDSDNLIADSLLKQVGQSYYQTQGNFSNGTAAMRQIFKQLKVDLSDAQLADGSGLSRYNLLSANQLSRVLKLIYLDPRFTGLQRFLPIAGLSGTLRYKPHFTQPPLKSLISAKTGSMQGVANLAGFINLGGERDYLFVVLENGLSPHLKQQQVAPFTALLLQGIIDTLERDTKLSGAP
jgi:serine-type D-Ala-D-Ala carboxypeptidase/endopeptidase (penicillin-binding protein 4)